MLPAVVLIAPPAATDEAPPVRRRARLAFAVLSAAAVVYLAWRQAVIGRMSQTGYLTGGFFTTMLTMVRVAVDYVRLVVWPHPLSADYSGYEPSLSAADWRVWLCAAALLAAAAAVLAVRRRDPVVAFGLAWFGLLLAPVANVVPTMQFMAERFLYTPLVGVAAAAGALFAGAEARRPLAARAAAALLLAASGAVTLHRLPVWRDEISLFGATVRDTPGSALRPRRNLLTQLLVRGRYSEALPLAETLWRQSHTFKSVGLRWKAEHARHLGFLKLQLGDVAGGTNLLRQAMQIDPSYSVPFVDMGVTCGRTGDHAGALAWFDAACRADPSDSDAWYNRGVALRETGNLDDAKEALRRAVALGPSAPAAHKTLAALLWSQRDIVAAEQVYREAARLWPADREIPYWLERARMRH